MDVVEVYKICYEIAGDTPAVYDDGAEELGVGACDRETVGRLGLVDKLFKEVKNE